MNLLAVFKGNGQDGIDAVLEKARKDFILADNAGTETMAEECIEKLNQYLNSLVDYSPSSQKDSAIDEIRVYIRTLEEER